MTEKVYTPPPITGYRQLTQTELDLINEAKALAEQCGAFIERLRSNAPDVSGLFELARGVPRQFTSLDQRWISIGATDLQTGFMAVIRGIAKPTSF